MPTKVDRHVASLPAGLLPLLSQKELETYYGVSDWTVRQWMKAGMPREPFGARGFRFDLDQVRGWMAEYAEQLAATA
ncbi:hypothetical protein [Streptomyces sp. SID8352]|uniref:hypothetical protein n=1 Tax=Streptomyces sp. SID8352 TaxID=2690338 RepID=UPI00136D8E7D|nr:hypothetical protein [Streptomyces sp. SID8352]MYU22899.1 hypothetical protein [Streptomyces sp. SID8352]